MSAIDNITSTQAQFLAPTWQSSIAQSSLENNGIGESFSSMLMAGVRHVDEAAKTSDSAVANFAMGQDIPPHQVIMALESARMELQFALQVRSRLVEGYQELMRMQL